MSKADPNRINLAKVHKFQAGGKAVEVFQPRLLQ